MGHKFYIPEELHYSLRAANAEHVTLGRKVTKNNNKPLEDIDDFYNFFKNPNNGWAIDKDIFRFYNDMESNIYKTLKNTIFLGINLEELNEKYSIELKIDIPDENSINDRALVLNTGHNKNEYQDALIEEYRFTLLYSGFTVFLEINDNKLFNKFKLEQPLNYNSINDMLNHFLENTAII